MILHWYLIVSCQMKRERYTYIYLFSIKHAKVEMIENKKGDNLLLTLSTLI